MFDSSSSCSDDDGGYDLAAFGTAEEDGALRAILDLRVRLEENP